MHAGIVHGADPGAYNRAAGGRVPSTALRRKEEAGSCHGNGNQQGCDCGHRLIADSHPGVIRKHGDEMCRPDS